MRVCECECVLYVCLFLGSFHVFVFLFFVFCLGWAFWSTKPSCFPRDDLSFACLLFFGARFFVIEF